MARLDGLAGDDIGPHAIWPANGNDHSQECQGDDANQQRILEESSTALLPPEAVSQSFELPAHTPAPSSFPHTAFFCEQRRISAGKARVARGMAVGLRRGPAKMRMSVGRSPASRTRCGMGPASWPISHICSIRAIGRPARPEKRPISVSFFLSQARPRLSRRAGSGRKRHQPPRPGGRGKQRKCRTTPCHWPFTWPRCEARTRKGTPCRQPATTKGHCCMHGGAKGSGAPEGKRNGAYRHGGYTRAAKAERRMLRVWIKSSRSFASGTTE